MPDVDVVVGRELGRLVRVVAGAHQLVGAPALDALQFGLDYVFYRRHWLLSTLSLREKPASGSPPSGVLTKSAAISFLRSDGSGRTFCPAGGGLPLLRRQFDLAQADRLRRDFDAFVLADLLERLLERQRPRRDEPDGLVARSGAHVRQLLLLRRVDVEVVGA